MKEGGEKMIGCMPDKEKKEFIKKINTKTKFEKWKEEWKEKVPKCKDFRCIHEMMSCGITVICGDCSIFRTFQNGLWYIICDGVNCIDCVERYECKETDKNKEHPKKVRK